jgi:hypothetical protein
MQKLHFKIVVLILSIIGFAISCESTTESDINDDKTNVENKLEIVAESSRLWTGVAVSNDKRLFANYPRWSDSHTTSVVEILESGQKVAYPNDNWNNWNERDPVAQKFVCVQSVYYYDGYLWILDSGNPMAYQVIEGAAKIVKVNLSTDTVDEIIYVDSVALNANSYLNDVRIYNNHLIITDSSSSGLIIINLANGKMIRRLAEHGSTVAQTDYQVIVEGYTVGLQVHSDGIAIDQENGYVYYQALTSPNLYRIAAEVLIDYANTEADVSIAVEHVGEFGAADGLAFANGKLYITAIEENAINVYNPRATSCETCIKANNLKWPDSISITDDGILYVTTSQLHLPRSQRGNYRIFSYNIIK